MGKLMERMQQQGLAKIIFLALAGTLIAKTVTEVSNYRPPNTNLLDRPEVRELQGNSGYIIFRDGSIYLREGSAFYLMYDGRKNKGNK